MFIYLYMYDRKSSKWYMYSFIIKCVLIVGLASYTTRHSNTELWKISSLLWTNNELTETLMRFASIEEENYLGLYSPSRETCYLFFFF